MADQDLVGRYGRPSDRRLPVAAGRWQLDLRHHQLDDPLEDVVLVANVVIQRHRLHAQLLGQPAHRQRVDPARIGELHGRAQDAFAAEWSAAIWLGRWLSGHGTSLDA
jgi:hypothetical protein